jgi:protein TonB
MESTFKIKITPTAAVPFYGLEEPPMMDYKIDVDKPKPVKVIKKTPPKRARVKKAVKSSTFVAKPNNDTTPETPIAANDDPVIVAPVAPVAPTDPEPKTPKNMTNVEFVPVYPGCESLGSNKEKVACMSSKINRFINKNFRKRLLENLNSNETQRIYVNFKIDSNGYVTDVVAQSHNERLKQEAQRVIRKLPVMKPGKQGDKSVDVLYTVPIAFNIK